jgi:hypothetical protein
MKGKVTAFFLLKSCSICLFSALYGSGSSEKGQMYSVENIMPVVLIRKGNGCLYGIMIGKRMVIIAPIVFYNSNLPGN